VAFQGYRAILGLLVYRDVRVYLVYLRPRVGLANNKNRIHLLGWHLLQKLLGLRHIQLDERYGSVLRVESYVVG